MSRFRRHRPQVAAPPTPSPAAAEYRAEPTGEDLGELVFRLELPTHPVPCSRKPGTKAYTLHLAPTMNEYASQLGWALDIVRKALDQRIAVAKRDWPRWSCHPVKTQKWEADRPGKGGKIIKGGLRETVTAADRRLVRVTRCSSRRLDEPSTDAIGGKIPIDRLRLADIIAGDSAKWLDGRVIVEVFAPR